MKKLVAILKNRWVVSLLGLLAVAVLVWFVGPLIAFAGSVPLASEVARLLVILVVAILWGLNNLRIQMQVNRMNRQMVGGFAEQSYEPAGAADTGQSAEEIAQLRERFDDALKVLRKSAGKSGVAGIYDLPWYIIIGPPGSGKTTALVNSGLKFPLAERFGREALRGVGGTRNCDWWFTDEAVLLDTAGRYVTQDSQADVDSAAWEGFLGLLKKHRRRRPINGALVAISLSDLLLQNEAQRAQHIRAIRLRLQELNKHLGIRYPVYVLLTKCDLVAGFMEFFDDLGKDERDQVWGVTLPYNRQDDGSGALEVLIQEIDRLLDRINRRVLWRMNQERDPQRRARIFAFPQQLASIRLVAREFLTEVFRPSRYEEAALLRGVYFTSGTQEGTPIDRVMGSLMRTFGIGAQAMPAHMGQGRSYFLTRLLTDVVFQEADLAGSNRTLEIQRAWLQKGAYAGAVGLTLLAVLAWTTSFTRNQVYVSRFKDRVNEYLRVSKEQPGEAGDFKSILPRLNAMRAVNQVYDDFRDGVPMLMGMGLYQGDGLGEAAGRAYRIELEKVLLPSIKTKLEQHLESGIGDPDFQYEALKTYLMLGDRSHLDPDLLSAWMDLDWQNAYAGAPEVQGDLDNHLKSILALGYQPLQLDKDIIESARTGLRQVPLAQLIYGRTKRDYLAGDKNPFRVMDAIGLAGGKVFELEGGDLSKAGIPGLFTYSGYHDYFQKQVDTIARQSSAENWVLDPERKHLTVPEIEKLQADMQQLYFTDYVSAWRKLLNSLSIVRFRNIRHAADVLETLSGPVSPLRSLLQAVARNTELDKSSGLLARAQAKAGEATSTKSRLARFLQSSSDNENVPALTDPASVVTKQFASLDSVTEAPDGGTAPVEQLIALLSQLYGQMDGMSAGMGTDIINVAQGAGGETIRRIQVEAARQPEPVKSWLQQIANNSRSVTMGGARARINDEWQSVAGPACSRAVSGRYPFSRDSTNEMTLVDFGKLFAPGGLIDGFFKDNLRSFVDQSRSTWRWKPVGNATLGIPDSVLRQFQRADMIKKTFFQDGGTSPSVSFGLKPVYLDANVQSFLLDLEGEKFRYRHGPARVQQAHWPAQDSTSQVRIVFEDASGSQITRSREGPWAWFRLLDQADLESVSSDRIRVTFTVSGRKSTWEIHASSVVNPFNISELQKFRCPGNL